MILPALAHSRRSLAFAVVFIGLAAGCVWPVLGSTWLPLVDLPEHASQVALWQAIGRDPHLATLYSVHLSSPYAAFYVVWRGLTVLGLSIETAGRVLAAACLVAVPIGLLVLLHVRRRPLEWSLLAFPFVFTKSFAWGFLPFCFTYALLFFALALFAAWLERRSWSVGITVAASGLLLLWGHALTAGFWGLACGLLALGRTERVRERVVTAIPLLPAGFGLALWLVGTRGAVVDPMYEGTAWQWAQAFFLSVYDGTTDAVTAAADLMQPILAAVLMAGVASVVRSRRTGGAGSFEIARSVWRAFDGPLLVAAVVALLLYLFMPFTMFGTAIINVRFASVALMLFIAALPPVPWWVVRSGLLACTVVVAGLVDAEVARAYAGFDREVGDPSALFAEIATGASIDSPEGSERQLPPLQLDVLRHFAVWAQLKTLGPAATFTDREHMLVQDSQAVPYPRFDSKLVVSGGAIVGIESPGNRLPDYLLFHTPQALERTELPVAGTGIVYRFVRRSGGLNLFRRILPT